MEIIYWHGSIIFIMCKIVFFTWELSHLAVIMICAKDHFAFKFLLAVYLLFKYICGIYAFF